jgi:hypothetical protein
VKHLHCTTCKFTLPVENPEESKAYAANMPMHCGQPMLADGADAPAPAAAEPVPEPKEEKKGFFSRSKKKK